MKKINKEQKFHIAKVALIGVVLLIISAVSFILPLRPTVSQTEKRELAKFPEFSVSAILDGSYFSDISLWFSDTVPFRDTLVAINAKIQNFLGTSTVLAGFAEGSTGDEIPDIPSTQPEEGSTVAEIITETTTLPEETTLIEATESTTFAQETSLPEETTNLPSNEETTLQQSFNNIYVYKNAAYEYYHFNKTASNNYVAAVNFTASKLLGKANVYCMIIPTSIDITLDEQVREKLSVSDQSQAIAYMLGSMNSNVRTVNIFNTLKSHSDEYLYFRTDHHWTALGAYYAYVDFCAVKGIEALPLNAFSVQSFDGFLGSFYNDSGMNPELAATPDRVDAYIPPCNTRMTVTQKNGTTSVQPLIYNVSNNAPANKYGCFIFGDNPFTVIENTDMSSGESCLVIKESFGNCFVPFLTYNYKYIYVMDFRYSSDTIVSLVENYGINDVIFCNNTSMTRSIDMVNILTEHIG